MRPVEEFLSIVSHSDKEAFVRDHPEPVLLFEHPAPRGRPPWTFKTARISQPLLAAAQKEASNPTPPAPKPSPQLSPRPSADREELHRFAVASLGSSGRWGDRISVGRATNNDISIADRSVSKLHACFTADADGVTVCDMGSRNGTKVRGEMIASGSVHRLETGDTVTFGTVSVTLLNAAELYEFLQRTLSGSTS
jgi:hypothetical protein